MEKLTEERYAVVDLEATGTGIQANIIQVGIVLIDGDEIVGSYATDVNPHEKLESHIVQLTGITDEQLAQAPPFSQVAKQIYELIGDRIFVAHNVQFDANLLAEHLFLEGFDLKSPRVDTVELAQVCFPTVEKYSLSYLCQELFIPLSAAHTAIADATATAHLFLKIRQKLASLPKPTLHTLSHLSEHLIYETGQVIDVVYQQTKLSSESFEIVNGILLRPLTTPLPSQDISEDFLEVAETLGLSHRPVQTRFAQTVADSIVQNRATIIEGTAGLGKTYGYLLPLIARLRGRQLIVALPTKMLQEQIMTGEAASIAATFKTTFCSIKSSKNYIDVAKFAISLKKIDSNRLLNRYKMQLLVWLLETETGDFDEIRQKMGMDAYFDYLGHSGQLNPTTNQISSDFWARVTNRAQNSQVVVTNHAFLLTTLSKQPDYLTDKILVIDEAQRFFLAMENQARSRVNLTEVLLTLHQLLSIEKNLLKRRLLERLQASVNQLVTHYYHSSDPHVSAHVIATLRQDLLEWETNQLTELCDVVSSHYNDFWLETTYQAGKRQTDLIGASLEFLDISHYLTERTKAYFISATVEISERVNLLELMGIKDYDYYKLDSEQLNNQQIWIDDTMPVLDREGEAKAYRTAVTERVIGLLTLGLPVLVLLTSKQAVHDLSDDLGGLGISHLAQGKHGEAFQLKKRFDRGEQSLLLGTGAFWEGVDFAQQERLVIVIPKLPFDHPKDKFFKKITHHLLADGKKPFYDYTLPVTGLRLRQALGRGKRRVEQRSAVVILDSRLVTRSYGKTLRRSLEREAPVLVEKFSQILSDVEKFCYNGKD